MSHASPPDKLIRDAAWRRANALHIAAYNRDHWRLITCHERKLAKASSFTERRKLEAAIARGKVKMAARWPMGGKKRKGKQ